MLSLIAIAKNEAAGIAEFLRHHADLVDEMVVMDTGSDDNTADLARLAGARVETFTWCDDFAAARNAALDAARGDWVITLDIDERVSHRDFATVRRMASGSPQAFLMPQWNYCDDPRHDEWQPVTGRYPELERSHPGYFASHQYRLFKVLPGLRWEGCVHEDLSPAVMRKKLRPKLLDVPVHHYGYVRSREDNAHRNAFYGRLIRRKFEENPDHPMAALELAWILLQEGRGREAFPVLEKVATMENGGSAWDRARTMLARLYREDGRADEAMELYRATVTTSPKWIFGWTGYLKMLGDQDRWPEAEAALARAEAQFPDNVLLLKEKFRILVNREKLVAAVKVGKRITELSPQLQEYARLTEKCETLARNAGLL